MITENPKQIYEKRLFEETEHLGTLVMWGPAGVEAVLAQLLPEKQSCFLEQFDVLKARKEFEQTLELIGKASPETKIIQLKNEWASLIESKSVESTLTYEETLARFQQKAEDYYNQNQYDKDTNPNGRTEEDLKDAKQKIEQVLKEDIEKYGKNTALVMNQMLVNGSQLPMANVIYARDQSNCIGDTIIFSSMRHEIRRPEVALYRSLLEHAGVIETVDNSRTVTVRSDGKFVDDNGNEVSAKYVTVTGNGRFEGGDAIVTGGIAYVGVGGRTNMEGIRQIAPAILRQGLRLVVAYDEDRDKGRASEMKAMHYDTYAMPASPESAVVCVQEMEAREKVEFTMDESGQLWMEEKGKMIEHFPQEDISIIPLSDYDQVHFAPNFVHLGNKKVILSLDNESLAQQLREQGYTVYTADLEEITKGYGGLHCMSAPIKRG